MVTESHRSVGPSPRGRASLSTRSVNYSDVTSVPPFPLVPVNFASVTGPAVSPQLRNLEGKVRRDLPVHAALNIDEGPRARTGKELFIKPMLDRGETLP